MPNNKSIFGNYSEKALTSGMCKLITQKSLSLLEYYTVQHIDFYKIINPYANSKILDNLSIKIFDDMTEIGLMNGIDRLIDTILREHLFYYKIKPTDLNISLFGDFSEESIITAVTQIIDNRIAESFFFEGSNSKDQTKRQTTYSSTANQYVYILYNEILYQEYNTHIYKIGWTSRTPQIRADEISQGTGVVGKWKVGHQWKVEDGYWLEQQIFKHFAQYRLPSSEQFNFRGQTIEQVANKISLFINNNGESPKRAADIAKKKQQQELKEKKQYEKFAQEQRDREIKHFEKERQEQLKKIEAEKIYAIECEKIRNEINQQIKFLIQEELKLKKRFYESVIPCVILGCVIGLFADHVIGWGVVGAIVGYFIYISDKNKEESVIEKKYSKYQNLPNNLERLKKTKSELLQK